MHRSTHELDVVALETSTNATTRIFAIGEAKWRTDPVDVGQLE